MGLYKSKAGVPYELDVRTFQEQELEVYVQRLTVDWMKDSQRVDWAAQQSARANGTEPEGLIEFIALTTYGMGWKEIFDDLDARGVHTLRIPRRDLGKLSYEYYQGLRRLPFDEWVFWAERCVAVLAGEGIEGPPDSDMPTDS
jgi:hypothetical protein